MKPVTQPRTSQPSPGFSGNAVGRLFFFEASGDRIHSVNTDGADRKVILSGCRAPDGIVLDLEPTTFIALTWALPLGTMVLSNAVISTVRSV